MARPSALSTERVPRCQRGTSASRSARGGPDDPPLADAPRGRYDAGPMDETATARVTGVAQVFDLHALKAFAPDRRVRKMLFKTDQLWSEIACYQPRPSTVMHQHPRGEEAIFVLQGTPPISIDRPEGVVPAGPLLEFPPRALPRGPQ